MSKVRERIEHVETYGSVGVEVYRLGVLNKEYSNFMIKAAGMRNVLVHGYARVNPRIVMKAAREELPDKVAEIVARIRSAVEKLNIDPELPSKGLSEVFKGRVKVAFLFGSRVKGYTFKGDYDFAVYFGREYTLRELGRLVVDLSAFLGVEKVDVVVLDNAPPSMVLEAVSGTPVYYEDAYTLFEVRYTLMRDALDIIWAEKLQSSILREKYLGER